MKKIMVMAALMAGSFQLAAQQHSAFEVIKSETPDEVIYRGLCTFEDIGKVKAFDLAKKAEEYKPDPKVMEILANRLGEYRMVIYLGTWCDDSHRLIPQLYRVLQDAQYPTETIELYALDHAKKGKNGEEKRYGITNVPTILLIKDGAEKGRITEVADKSVEADLLKITEQK